MKQSKYNRKRIWALLALLCVVVGLIPFKRYVRRNFESVLQIMRGKKTVAARIAEYGPSVRKRLAVDFKRLGVEYPPSKAVLLFLKNEKKLEIWVQSDKEQYEYLKSYPVLGLSGHLGPKLREGDGQVPEGIYHIDSLNPNSGFHLSIRLDYPNDFDRHMGKLDGLCIGDVRT